MVSFPHGKFIKCSPSTEKAYQNVVALWLPESDWETICLNHGFLVFHFTLSSGRDRALLDGPGLLTMPPLLSNHLILLFICLQRVYPKPPYRCAPLNTPRPCGQGHHLSSYCLGSVALSSLTRLLNTSRKVILRELLSKWISSIL